MVKHHKCLAELIEEAELRPPDRQELPTHTPDGVPIDYWPVCYFHLFDLTLVERYGGPMFIPLDDRVFRQRLFVDICKEDPNGKRVKRYGICRPCAEAHGLVPVDENGDPYLI